jgi:hypothetical protein
MDGMVSRTACHLFGISITQPLPQDYPVPGIEELGGLFPGVKYTHENLATFIYPPILWRMEYGCG